MRVEQPDADVECLVVIEHAHLGLVRRMSAWHRIALEEIAAWLSGGPCGVVELAVDGDWCSAAHGADGSRCGGWSDGCGLLRAREGGNDSEAQRERDSKTHEGKRVGALRRRRRQVYDTRKAPKVEISAQPSLACPGSLCWYPAWGGMGRRGA